MKPTYGNIFKSQIDNYLSQLQKFIYEGYAESDVSEIVSSLGTKLELFLKISVFPEKNPRDNLITFINELSSVESFDSTDLDKLHDFRKLYNKAKHDPNAGLNILSVVEILKEMIPLINSIIEVGLGDTDTSPKPQASRVYWISAYDHYIDGDTEVHIIIPADTDHWLGAPTFDHVNVKLLEWDEVKSKLNSSGTFKDGAGYIPENQIEILKKDSDFLSAHVWEGEYKVLLKILAQHELRLNLISGLNRHDIGHNMQVAFLMAMLDSIAPDVTFSELRNIIERCAIEYYGVPADYIHKDDFLDRMLDFISKIEISKWVNLSGPNWLSEDKYNKKLQNATSVHTNNYMLIDSNYSIAMKWSAK